MPAETKVQGFIHALEEGGWVSRIRKVLLLAAIAAIYCIVILGQFKGLSHAKGMDQAQIGRQLAAGKGFTTKFIRPLAYNQIVQAKGAYPGGDLPDTYNAPLNPFIDSLLLRFTWSSWQMTNLDIVYTSDRVIAGASLFFFVLSVGVNFSIAKRLFDRRLALLGMGLILICDVFWNFSLSGLPQMLMLLIFSVTTYCLLRAVENLKAGRRVWLWLALSGLGFGLLILAHGLAVWIFLGALLFIAVAFRPRTGAVWMRVLLHPGWVPVLLVAAVCVPWLLRTYQVCGHFFGVAIYSGYGQLIGTESQVMRSLTLDPGTVSFAWFRSKVQSGIITQISSLYSYLGHSPIAPVFFLSLLHFFRKPETASFRWGILSMWVFATLGMAVFGLDEDGPIHANDLHVLFIPLTTYYGLAFTLVLWSRLTVERAEMDLRLVRWTFFTAVYLLAGFPLAHMLLTASGRVQWPPYVPPSIADLREWTDEDEIIASDMPWAVAWYADRRSLWVPDSIATFMDLHDYNKLNGPIVGLYLTPISGDAKFISGIWKGEYRAWTPFILRTVSLKDFPLQAVTGMDIGGECVFYADRNRWSVKTE